MSIKNHAFTRISFPVRPQMDVILERCFLLSCGIVGLRMAQGLACVASCRDYHRHGTWTPGGDRQLAAFAWLQPSQLLEIRHLSPETCDKAS